MYGLRKIASMPVERSTWYCYLVAGTYRYCSQVPATRYRLPEVFSRCSGYVPGSRPCTYLRHHQAKQKSLRIVSKKSHTVMVLKVRVSIRTFMVKNEASSNALE